MLAIKFYLKSKSKKNYRNTDRMKTISRRVERSLRWAIFFAGSLVIFFFPLGHVKWLIWLIWGLVTLQVWGQNRVPVLTFHSISDQGDWIREPSLVVPVRSFAAQIRWLCMLGYQGLFLDELYDLRKRGGRTGRKVVITFDDGYLDNWVGAFYILKECNMKGTIFVSTGWLDTNKVPRPRLPENGIDQITWSGYLGPGELKSLQDSGIVDIQSHAVSHDHIFVSDKITGFVAPDIKFHTIYCHLHPKDKPRWYENDIALPLGYPLFSIGEALEKPNFYPDQDLQECLEKTAAKPGFFNEPDWEAQLRKTASDYKKKYSRLGHFESMADARKRWMDELLESRNKLELLTGKPVQHLAWPRNKFNPDAQKIALDIGYISTTTVLGLHNTSRDPHRVERVSIVSSGYPLFDVARILLEVWVFKGYYVFWPLLFALQRFTKSYVLRRNK